MLPASLNWGRSDSQGDGTALALACAATSAPLPLLLFLGGGVAAPHLLKGSEQHLTDVSLLPPGLDSESLYRPEPPAPCTGEGALQRVGGRGIHPNSPSDIALLHPQTGP